MAPRQSRCMKALICASVLLSLVLYWCGLAASRTGDENVIWRSAAVRPITTGIDFSSLFTSAFPEPSCDPGQVLLILVTSAPWHSEARQAIRTTWAAPVQTPYSWQTVFLIGHTSDDQVTEEIEKEQQKFGDILLGNYLDTYRNLTRKVLHGLKWARDRCQPEYILKTDDDCFVNTDGLPTFLTEHNTIRSGLYAGSLFPREKRMVIREPSSKWYVSRRDYAPDLYPPYASGIGYILSLDAVDVILHAAEYVPPIPVEDVYIGVLADVVGIQVKSSGRFAKHNVKWRVCNYRYLMVIHHLNPLEQELAKENMIKARTACQNSTLITRWK
ncbi:beta-1,3-galactosyltransferase 5-like [Ambystoma mexicanum]|uniref:beta-1,3-galactosyltransferase 5-like n=1 Tax=Ambystoma mexicanum TaxID=8296 RepID=UPI0037E7DE2E